MKLKYCIRSMRLRTLPLSIAGIMLGVLLACADYRVDAKVVIFLVLTTIALQILSNLSNELGDTLSGTDTDDRQGMVYSIQSGGLSISDMKKLIAGAAVCSAIFGALMIWSSFGTLLSLHAIMFLLLGAAAIWAAMHYTLGRNPYGARGLGDVYVFLFFGLATVLGGYFLCAHEIPTIALLLPASAIGFFSIGVLNVNKIRAMKTDAATRKTVAIRLGERRAKIYQTVLITLGWLCMLAYCQLRMYDPWHYLFVATLPLFVLHLVGVWKRNGRSLDPMLPLLVMSSFAFSLLAGLGYVMFLLR